MFVNTHSAGAPFDEVEVVVVCMCVCGGGGGGLTSGQTTRRRRCAPHAALSPKVWQDQLQTARQFLQSQARLSSSLRRIHQTYHPGIRDHGQCSCVCVCGYVCVWVNE
jgi:hypothetical protein